MDVPLRSSPCAAPARHDLVAVEPDDWAAVAATRAPLPRLAPEAAALLGRWGGAGWPAIARRPAPGDPPGAVPVGVPLPPSAGKARVALSIPAGVAWRPVPDPGPDAVEAAAPTAWRPTLGEVRRLGSGLGLAPRVFGALLWRALTGLDHLHAGSDLDLLWPVSDAAALPPLLAGLARLDAGAPVRIDGEVLTPRGGVSWRELAAARPGDAVLVKGRERAGFLAAAELFAGTAPCP